TIAQRHHRVERVAVAVAVLAIDCFRGREPAHDVRLQRQRIESHRRLRLEGVEDAWIATAARRRVADRATVLTDAGAAEERARQDQRSGRRTRREVEQGAAAITRRALHVVGALRPWGGDAGGRTDSARAIQVRGAEFAFVGAALAGAVAAGDAQDGIRRIDGAEQRYGVGRHSGRIDGGLEDRRQLAALRRERAGEDLVRD